MRLSEIMTPVPGMVSPTDTIARALHLIVAEGSGSVPVVQDGYLVGVITDSVIASRVIGAGIDPAAALVRDYLIANPTTARPDLSDREALAIMVRDQLQELLVVEGGRLVGIVSRSDFEVAPRGGDEIAGKVMPAEAVQEEISGGRLPSLEPTRRGGATRGGGSTTRGGLPGDVTPPPPTRGTRGEPRRAGGVTRDFRTAEPAAPSTSLERYPYLDCPDQTSLNERMSLFVRLQIQSPEPGAQPLALEQRPGEPVEVEVVVRAPGFQVLPSNTRVMTVDPVEDTEARFVLIAQRAGEQQIRADFYQYDRRIGTLQRTVRVGEAPAAEVVPPPAAPVALELSPEALTAPADLEIRVDLDRQDGRTLRFELHSGREIVGYHHAHAGEVALRETPLQKMQLIYGELSGYAAGGGTPQEQADAVQRLADLGMELWDELIPQELKNEYWKFKSQVQSILITSDEPWVPWEILKPYRYTDDNEREDDAYWCQQFAVSRWLSGPSMAERLSLGGARPVAPAQANLAAVAQEVDLISRWIPSTIARRSCGRWRMTRSRSCTLPVTAPSTPPCPAIRPSR
jgi:CBS domain-containing protein